MAAPNEIADGLLHAFYGVAAYFVSRLAHRLIEAYRVPKDSVRWVSELRADLLGLVEAKLTVAMFQLGIGKKLDKVPKEFVDPVLTLSDLVCLVDQACQTEFEAAGLVKPRTWKIEPHTASAGCLDAAPPPSEAPVEVVEMPVFGSMPPSPLSPPRLPEYASMRASAPPSAGPPMVFVNGRLVPRRR